MNAPPTLMFSLVILLPVVTAIDVQPGSNVTYGNCSEPLDQFLCNSTCSSSPVVQVHFSQGHYQLNRQQSCVLHVKERFILIGEGSTSIECMDFNIILMDSSNIFISSIELINCGDTVSDNITQTISKMVPSAYFGNGTRFAMMLLQVVNVSMVNVTMINTLGYGIVAFNALGNVNLTKVTIENTTFENDYKYSCKTFDYGNVNSKTNFSCSGSGALFLYHDMENNHLPNTDLTVNHCVFQRNKNILPIGSFDANSNALNTGYYQEPLPVIGAGSITLMYTQSTFYVTTIISDTKFSSNIGTLSPTVSIFCISSAKGITQFDSCTFDNNISIFDLAGPYLFHPSGGISLYYTLLRNAPGISTNLFTNGTEVNLLTVIKSNFTRLIGKSGAGIYIKKISPDAITVVIKIVDCNFIGNKADTGSALYAVENKFQGLAFTAIGGLNMILTNVNAVNNSLSPGSTLEFGNSKLITGVFAIYNCQANLTCTKQCNFADNRPSVFYGYNSAIALSGEVKFKGNEATNGAAFKLLNTVVYINTGTMLYFGHNHAQKSGGAIDISISTVNVQSQDICPIQFVGSNTNETISNLADLHVSITFEKNTAGKSQILQALYANVFYICSWYPGTLVQANFDINSPIINNTRPSVYHQLFNFGPNETANGNLLVAAYLPCLCYVSDTSHKLSHNFTECSKSQNRRLDSAVVPGRSFNISLIALDVVGSVGYSTTLDAEIRSNDNRTLALASSQARRPFSVTSCAPVEFVVFRTSMDKFSNGTIMGILSLSVAENFNFNFTFNVSKCPIGFKLTRIDELQVFACTCDKFFNSSAVRNNINCDSKSGLLTRSIPPNSWLSVEDNDIQFVRLCLASYCNNQIKVYDLSNRDTLCVNHRTGRVCGACKNGFSKVFGSDICKKCNNTTLAMILLYAALGIILVFIIISLKLTVTLGAINGLVFFCNIISINEQLFFNVNNSRFSFVRVFISVINLDLGFTICFYDGMIEVVKSGLQFVFPIYLWLIIFLIVITSRRYLHHNNAIIKSAVPVLATLIFLSYSKLLRTIIEAFSFIIVQSSNHGSIIAWEPDPTVAYLTGDHIPLFLIALCFFIFFILPVAIGFTFPSVVLRSKKLSYLFPLIDSFLVPYKDKYRYWFGIRVLVLIYLSTMEAIVFQYTEVLLVSSIAVVGAFALLQAYLQPFKSTTINILELIFMSIFLLLSAVTLYFYPSIYGYSYVNTAVTVFGALAFFLFCVVVVYHLHTVCKGSKWYASMCQIFEEYFRKCLPKRLSQSMSTQPQHLSLISLNSTCAGGHFSSYDRYRESLLEHM